MKRLLNNMRLIAGGFALLTGLSGQVHAQAVSIISPVQTDPLTVNEPVTFEILITGLDDSTPVSVVRLFKGATFIGFAQEQIPGNFYTLDYTPTQSGALPIQAEVELSDASVLLSDEPVYQVTELSDEPSVSILAPASGSRYLPGTNLPVQVVAQAPGGLVSRVDFLLNGIQVSSVSSAPFRTEIQLPSIGSYTLVARAFNNEGTAAESEEVVLIAGPADEERPRVVIDFPLPLGNGDTVNDVSYASAMFLNATAVDPNGTISNVEFFINGQSLGLAEHRIGDVFSLFYDPNALGNYIISAKATDNQGNEGWSVPLVLDVGPLERPLPKVKMIQPFEQSIVGRVVGIFAEVDSGLIGVDRVDFFANGVFLGSVAEPTSDDLYSFNWVPEEPGTYDLQTRVVQIDPAEATWDNWKISDPVSINIVSAPPGEPTIQVTNPVSGGQYTALNPIAIQADALDPLGSILNVSFYANGKLVDVDNLYPYTVAFSPPSPGSYLIVAEMESDRGIRQHSDPVEITVDGSQYPNVQITSPMSGAAIGVGTPVLITASAGSTGGNNLVMHFFSNGDYIGTDDTFPYSLVWTPQSVGNFALVAAIVEEITPAPPPKNLGVLDDNYATSPEVNVKVNPSELPTASITKPSGVNPTAGSDVLIEVEADDVDGFVTSVEFFVNGFSVGTDLSEPFAVAWSPGSAGIYNLSALVIDNSGNQVVTSRPVTVGVPIGIPPRVTLSVTGSGNVTPGSRVVVLANVYDDTPEDLEVTFFMNGSQIGETDTEAPYSVIVDPEIGGGVFNNAYSLTALVSDPDGNVRADSLDPLYISDFSVDQPSINIINISDGDNFTRGSRVPIRAEVRGGATNSLNSVVFYANGEEIGRVPSGEVSGRYSFDWLPEDTGTVEITAASLLDVEFYDHDRDSGGLNPTPRIPVTPVNVAFPATINVNEAIGVLPSISLDIFPARTNLAIGSKVLVYADAQDLGGNVEKVEFFNDGIFVGEDTEAPFTYLMATTHPGNFAINALATDSDGNVVTSTVVNLDVADRVITRTPEISLTVPDSGQEGNPLSLRASTEGFVTGPEGVRFYVNGQFVGEEPNSPYTLNWLANLEGNLTFFATAQQPLSDGTLVTTVSQIVDSFLVDNLPPEIGAFTVSYAGADPVTKPNPVTGDALNFSIELTDTGPIRFVELLRDGESIKTVEGGSSPFDIVDVPPGAGLYEYTVVVTDRGGLQAQSSTLSVNVQQGSGGPIDPTLPEILSFTSDVIGSSSLVNLPITFTVVPVDENGIERVELFQDGNLISTVFSEPYTIEFTPTAAGEYAFKARATNVQGNRVSSESLVINVRQPDPLGRNTDFVYQTFLDLLLKTPTLEERNHYTNRIESEGLSRDRFIRELINPADGQDSSDYDPVRGVLLANRFLLGQWPSRSDLEVDVETVRDGGLVALTSSLMPLFEGRFMEATGAAKVPDILSSDGQVNTYIQYLWQQKYGSSPSASQLNLARLHFRAGGRDAFTASFISDVEVISTGSSYITVGLGFTFSGSNPPDDSYLREADAASLLINLLRVTPSDEEVASLAEKLFATQVSEILNDPRYASRFVTAFNQLKHYTNGWKESDWFGWFNASYEPWVYHSEQGWITFSTVGQDENSFWYWDAGMGWMWTQSQLYPFLYNSTESTWLYSLLQPYSEENGRWFFDYGQNLWINR